MLKKLLLAVAASCAAMAMNSQVQIKINPEDPILSDQPVKISNNGRVVSKQGLKLLHYKDLEAARVGRDTLTLTLKPESLKRLNADKNANYEPISAPKGGEKKPNKKATAKADLNGADCAWPCD